MTMLEVETKTGRDIHHMRGSDGCLVRSRASGEVVEPPICSRSCAGCVHFCNNPGCKLYEKFERKEITIEEMRIILKSNK